MNSTTATTTDKTAVLLRSGTDMTLDAGDDEVISEHLTTVVVADTGPRLQSLSYTCWPSKKIRQDLVEAIVQSIWSKYLADNAECQICMPSQVLTNTRERVHRLLVYGPDVFGECLLDPIRTLERDIFPRFLVSPFYAEMNLRVSSLAHVPAPTELVIPLPQESLFTATRDVMYLNDRRMFSLGEILQDRLLCKEFLAHLQTTLQSENLLCIQMIRQYVDMSLNSDPNAVNQAWSIYRYH